MKGRLEQFMKDLFLSSLKGLQCGFLELVCPDKTYTFGDAASPLRAMAVIHDERFFVRAVTGADIGIGESFMDGDWTSPDLVALVRVATRNLRRLDAKNPVISGARRLLARVRHTFRENSLLGSRKNIQAHYDLGNDFYRLFLDNQMLYSCGYFQAEGESLESAQINKMERICRKLRIEPGDRVLEIGCGWGAFAVYAAREHGAHVTGVTISEAQFQAANELVLKNKFAAGSVKILKQDYRLLQGQYDKIVSIEMFEAVGLAYYDEFFRACDELLTENGSMLMQTITMPEQELKEYRRRVDWIQTYIFPGSDLAYVGEMQRALSRVTQMNVSHLECMGLHYARTLSCWRERYLQHLDGVQRLGFDEKFIRMWDFYLSWCEGAFRERYVNVAQIVFAKNGTSKALLGDPVAKQRAFAAGGD